MTRNMLAGALLLTVSGTVAATHHVARGSAPPECQVEGVWTMVSMTFKGKPVPVTGKQRKIVTKRHYMWLEMDNRRDTIPLKTALDTARHYAMSGGSGRYSVSGHTYTEQLEYFPDPELLGKTLKASCRVEANRWYHTYANYDLFPTGGFARRDSSTEVYIRAE